ncbi:MAG: glycosyltransferase family 4 protein [Cellulophaga sp.]|uniref:glycosyltransferase family 4 protein n=1 Tax=Cellulophaga sp. TaxID=1972202 RepID=UPI003263CECD
MQKVLIIAYYWPPAGGPGVQRWLKFVTYLRDFNIEPVVYVPENPSYPIVDTSFVNEIPDGIKIYKHKINEPYGWASFLSKNKTKKISSGLIQSKNQSVIEKILLWVRGNFFIPDARKNWVKPSVTYLTSVLKEEQINTVITTGPPHSVHLIGLKLKEKLGVNWVADFRDPWTSIGYHKKLKLSKASAKKHKYLEHLVLNSADSIIVTSNTTKTEFKEITTKPIEVITNGFDGAISSGVALDAMFTISHIGSLLTGRNPENLWQALSELCNENEEFKNSLSLQFIGVVSEDVLETIYKYNLKSYVNLIGYVSHTEALAYQEKSQVLLLSEIDSADTIGIIAGKLFEYMRAKRPILAIGPKGWEVSTIIKETNTGVAFSYNDTSNLKSLLLDWFYKYQTKKLNVNSTNINTYSRKERTAKLANHLYGYRI